MKCEREDHVSEIIKYSIRKWINWKTVHLCSSWNEVMFSSLRRMISYWTIPHISINWWLSIIAPITAIFALHDTCTAHTLAGYDWLHAGFICSYIVYKIIHIPRHLFVGIGINKLHRLKYFVSFVGPSRFFIHQKLGRTDIQGIVLVVGTNNIWQFHHDLGAGFAKSFISMAVR